jgi:hypothetical protein
MAEWLYAVDGDGLLVKPKFIARLKERNATAMRKIAQTDFTALYRKKFCLLNAKRHTPGLFWSDMPALVRIPFVRGRASPPAWLPDYVTYRARRMNKRSARIFKKLTANEGAALSIKFKDGGGIATVLKPNPKFELVVVNKYDRAALLHLLDALDPAMNVEAWLVERTSRTGATRPSVLRADYEAWCERRGDAATGSKSFVQALVAAGVVKLKRGKDGERYELELRRA